MSVFERFPFATFLSTPPRGRRPADPSFRGASVLVSIHASAREATLPPVGLQLVDDVSIHASAREATGLQLTHSIEIENSDRRAKRNGEASNISIRCVKHPKMLCLVNELSQART